MARCGVRALAVAGAALAAAMVWSVARLAGSALEVAFPGQPPMTIGLPLVLAFSLAAGLAGWGLLVALRRLTRRANAIWTGAAVVVLLLSFFPLSTVDTTSGSRIALALMHIAVATVLIPGLRRGVHSPQHEQEARHEPVH